MKKSITVVYNEILPIKKAHDVFLVQECAALAKQFDVTLLCGKGSLPDKELFTHYKCDPFTIKRLPIVRKNNPFNLSWNRPFFHACQMQLNGVVILSVLKQAAYHLKRRKPGLRYIYEVHQLSNYNGNLSPMEREVMDTADQIVVTTTALKNCIHTKTPISVVPLAVKRERLPPIPKSEPFVLTYVGQLYKGQGVEELLRAAHNVELRIIGGTAEEIERLKPLNPRAKFYGFCPPSHIEKLIGDSHAFVAPFELTGRMPFVAHTKLHEYSAWGRPFIAPDTPVVREHFSEGVLLYKPGQLAQAIDHLRKNYKPVDLPTFSWEERVKRLSLLLS